MDRQRKRPSAAGANNVEIPSGNAPQHAQNGGGRNGPMSSSDHRHHNKDDGHKDRRNRRRNKKNSSVGGGRNRGSSSAMGTMLKFTLIACGFLGFLALVNITVSRFRDPSSISSPLKSSLSDFTNPYHRRSSSSTATRVSQRVLHQPLSEPVEVIVGDMPSIYLPQRPRTMGAFFTYPISDHEHHTPSVRSLQYQPHLQDEEVEHHETNNDNKKTITSNTKQKSTTHHDKTTIINAHPLDPNMVRYYRTHTTVDVSEDELFAQEIVHADSVKDRKWYKKHKHDQSDTFETDTCKAQYKWQKQSFPTCNLLLEKDLTDLGSVLPMVNPKFDKNNPSTFHESAVVIKSKVQLIANGYWRDVWRVIEQASNHHIQNTNTNNAGNYGPVVLKTIRYEHAYDERNYDRHRRDAIAMERLTSSTYVVNIYAFCGNSGLFEYADGGSLEDFVFDEVETRQENGAIEYITGASQWSPQEKIMIAHQLSSGLSDVHNFAKENVAAIAHTDITPGQFVFIGDGETGIFKLNDFNRCRFIRWNAQTQTTCPFHVGSNPGGVSIVVTVVVVVWSFLCVTDGLNFLLGCAYFRIHTILCLLSSARLRNTHTKMKLKRLMYIV